MPVQLLQMPSLLMTEARCFRPFRRQRARLMRYRWLRQVERKGESTQECVGRRQKLRESEGAMGVKPSNAAEPAIWLRAGLD
jgi:hypothetical protein